MASPSAREPLEALGHNTDVSFRGRVYHIQTESRAEEAGIAVTTLVYYQGSLLNKLATRQPHDSRPEDLRDLVESQHLKMLAAIKKGEYA